MRFFIDTANIDDIREAAGYGLLDGVTTNPSLMAREGLIDQTSRIRSICQLTPAPVTVVVLASTPEHMIEEGRRLSRLATNVVVQIPMTLPGLQATQVLSSTGLKVNMTLIFSVNQAILAAKAGAFYVSPFVGLLDDTGVDGMHLVDDILAVYNNYEIDTEIIVSNVRNPGHVQRAALVGADICSLPLAVAKQLACHPLTDQGLSTFLSDHAKAAAH
jgi:transaldolase